jgi:hypothetical protein
MARPKCLDAQYPVRLLEVVARGEPFNHLIDQRLIVPIAFYSFQGAVLLQRGQAMIKVAY